MRRINGRFTLYGEFLMHARTWGLVAPVPWFLTDEEVPVHPTYSSEQDVVAGRLASMGLRAKTQVGGDLPFGLGFASSTALTLLHLDDQVSPEDRETITNLFDWMQHGFRPSGLDHASVSAQRPGFFRAGEWRRVEFVVPMPYFVRREPGDVRIAGETRRRVESHFDKLEPLANALTDRFIRTGELNLDVLSDYASVLLDSGVYSPSQYELIREAMSASIVAKGIGGLYNKAVLLLGDPTAVLRFVNSHDLEVL